MINNVLPPKCLFQRATRTWKLSTQLGDVTTALCVFNSIQYLSCSSISQGMLVSNAEGLDRCWLAVWEDPATEQLVKEK